MSPPSSSNKGESMDPTSISSPSTQNSLLQPAAPLPTILSTNVPSTLLAAPISADTTRTAIAGADSLPGFDTFHLFNTLPLELRLQIIRLAAAVETEGFVSLEVLEVSIDIAEANDCGSLSAHSCQVDGPDASFPIITFTTPARNAHSALVLLAVNREARAEMIIHLAAAGIHALNAGKNAFIYYKPDDTTIYINNMRLFLKKLEEFDQCEKHRITFEDIKKFALSWDCMVRDDFVLYDSDDDFGLDEEVYNTEHSGPTFGTWPSLFEAESDEVKVPATVYLPLQPGRCLH
ncbi:unnamed protein product [Diplocarpon coronariae]|uniref:2EXR domain-containing protein n=1 Tax=Diplocarpon coronariae TaxID=2795749 RepID=A0A218YZA8_9HELO|nr:hypothetical protein B2J93_5356 [Marssonina coronariae]